jgi:hypothetical protein
VNSAGNDPGDEILESVRLGSVRGARVECLLAACGDRIDADDWR